MLRLAETYLKILNSLKNIIFKDENKGNLQLKYKNSKTAKTVYESLEVDNIGFLESKLKNNTIEYELDNDSLETFLSTADDLIASEIVVEKILETTKKE